MAGSFFDARTRDRRYLHSFPTRRSSDLFDVDLFLFAVRDLQVLEHLRDAPLAVDVVRLLVEDRKSTRLNSSHPSIAYVVFCWKKKMSDSRNLLTSVAPGGAAPGSYIAN